MTNVIVSVLRPVSAVASSGSDDKSVTSATMAAANPVEEDTILAISVLLGRIYR